MDADLTPAVRPPCANASWISRLAAGLSADFRFAMRMLAKNKGFAATALITLALCIGANTAIFSMLYALVIKPLPFREPAQIVEVYNSFPKAGLKNLPSNIVQYLDFKEHAPAFEHLALWQLGEFTLGEDGGPARIWGLRATADLFDVLGVQPLLGRFFSTDNHVPAADKVLVLTQSFWESNFQEDPGVIGRTMRLDGETYEIVGVAPHNFEALDARARFIRPVSWAPDRIGSRYGVSPRLYGRLKPDANISAAYTQVAALEQKVYDEGPPPLRDFLDRSGHIIGVDPVQSQRAEPVRMRLLVLQFVVIFVLLIGCVNVANLILARANARQGELAIRVALGAGRGVLARQLLVEGALLTGLGAGLGLALAWAALGATNRMTAQMMPNALPFAIDGRVLGYTAMVAMAIALVIGLLPVLHLLGRNLAGLMQSQGRGASGGRSVRAISDVLVVLQMAAALVLLTGAGLVIRSYANVLAVNPGFDSRQLIAARVALSADYRKDNRAQLFQQQLDVALREIPGVTVTFATSIPFKQDMGINAFTLRDYTLPEGASQPGAFHFGASPTYLETMRIPLREGRWFTESDVEKSRQVFVVDEDFANRYFAGGSAVGQHLTFGGPPEKAEDWPEIIGVVGNVRHRGVEEDPTGNPYLYHPLAQTGFGALSVFLRTSRPVTEILKLIREKVAAIDPALPVYQAGPMESVISASFSDRRLTMWLLGSFAGIALLLAAIGIYGVLAYDVSQRTREIGIRGAIGATSRQVVVLILRQGVWKTGVGLAIGVVGAILLSRFMTSLLYDVKPTDPLAYLVVAGLLLFVALLASYLPARRAARIDPIVALRNE